jgi:hypothetical protein
MVAQPKFSYDVVSIKSLQPQRSMQDVSGAQVNSTKSQQSTSTVSVDGQPLQASSRFWNSLFSRYGFSESIFKYFSHDEVFDRIATTAASDRVRICIQHNENRNDTLLAVSNPGKSYVHHQDLLTELDGKAESIQYHDGIVTSTHSPSVDDDFDILGDTFQNKYSVMTPIDGYGAPNIYLGLMRQVCSNGLVAMSRAFRQSVVVGKNDGSALFALQRVFGGFNNDQGFAALRDRVGSAGNSWASLHEASTLHKLLAKIYNNNEAVDLKGQFKSYWDLVGDIGMIYGLANDSQIATKRKRTLPVKCTVYELINFATELSTHHSSQAARNRLNAFVGDLITNDYDLEGSCSRFKDFADFHLPFTTATNTNLAV